MERVALLRRRVRLLTSLFIIALVVSGATAIPLERELNWLVGITGAERLVQTPASANHPGWAVWLVKVREALRETNARHPFLAYGTDWLAFGHFVIALVFVGAWRDPVRNIWLFQFGMIACVLVLPYTVAFGGLRGIPVYWRLIDGSFGVFGFVPMGFAWRWTREMAALTPRSADHHG